MNTTLDLKRDHIGLICQCLSLLGENGKLWFSANAKRFNESAGELEAALKPRFPNVNVSDLKAKTVDEDFRGRKTPGSYLIRCGA
jgi:23S rRNA G2069 N7-methylase RlmK/C1962 C5-methylase RlmI